MMILNPDFDGTERRRIWRRASTWAGTEARRYSGGHGGPPLLGVVRRLGRARRSAATWRRASTWAGTEARRCDSGYPRGDHDLPCRLGRTRRLSATASGHGRAGTEARPYCNWLHLRIGNVVCQDLIVPSVVQLPGHAINEERSLRLHRVVAERLSQDPSLLSVAKAQ